MLEKRKKRVVRCKRYRARKGLKCRKGFRRGRKSQKGYCVPTKAVKRKAVCRKRRAAARRRR